MTAFLVALVGAESTGKSTLAAALHQQLTDRGERVTWVPEYLREFCDRTGRTPRQDEQAGIATEQSRRIEQAAAGHDVVIADTTAVMTALYSQHVFGDASLLAEALAWHERVHLTLLTATDLPWQADGHQRDGPQARTPIDRALRTALMHHGLPFAVVHGQGPLRCQSALRSLEAARRPAAQPGSTWRHVCARCGDGRCEQLLRRHIRARGRPENP